MSPHRALLYTAGLTPENWEQISKEIRLDNEVAIWLRAMISIYSGKGFEEAMIASEVVNRICRARVLSKSKEEKPFYGLTQESFLPPIQILNPQGRHGTEAVRQFLLHHPTPLGPRHDLRIVDGENKGRDNEDRTLEDRRRELRASHSYQQNNPTPTPYPTPDKPKKGA